METHAYDVALRDAVTALTHIPANPSKPEYSELIQRAYVFADGGDATFVNASEQAAARFMARVVARAMLLQSQWKSGNTETPPSRFFVLSGGRGAGKTFFENYLLCRFNNQMTSVRTIAVRIALTKDHNLDERLDAWFYRQATRIVLRCYDKDSKARNPNNFRIPVLQWLRERGPDIDQKEVDVLELAFMQPSSDANLEKISDLMAERVVRFCLEEEGVSFVCLIDGYDRLARDAATTKRFATLKRSVDRLLGSSSKVPVAFIIAMRDTTYGSFAHPPPERQHTLCTVGTPAIPAVLAQRLNAVDRFYAAASYHDTTSDAKLQIRDAMAKFRDAQFDQNNLNELISTMNASMPNLRAAMQSLACAFLIHSTKSHSGYRIVENLVRHRHVFPPLMHTLRPKDGKYELQTEFDGPSLPIYDSVFAPLLFRQAAVDHVGNGYALSGIVHQIRILWQLKNAQKIETAIAFSQRLFRTYRYPVELTISLLDLLELHHCIQSCDSAIGDPDDVTLRRIKVTQHGTNLVTDVAFDPAFLNLSATRVQVPSSFVLDRSLVVLATLSPLERLKSVESGLPHWIAGKIVNSITLLNLITFALKKSRPLESDSESLSNERSLLAHVRQAGQKARKSLVHSCTGGALDVSMKEKISRNLLQYARGARG